jgi:hypothetical protein
MEFTKNFLQGDTGSVLFQMAEFKQSNFWYLLIYTVFPELLVAHFEIGVAPGKKGCRKIPRYLAFRLLLLKTKGL